MVKLSKKCSRCKTLKDLQFFPNDNTRRDGYGHRCNVCQKIYAKLHYQKYKHIYKERTKKSRIEKRLFTYNYKKTHPCVDCGEKDPVVLDFDHRNREEKTGNISKMVQNRTSIKNLEKEIAKCDIRCANCHRRRTAKQLNWFSAAKISL